LLDSSPTVTPAPLAVGLTLRLRALRHVALDLDGTLGVVVLSGEATATDVTVHPAPPDLVVSDVGEFGRLLAAVRGVEQAFHDTPLQS